MKKRLLLALFLFIFTHLVFSQDENLDFFEEEQQFFSEDNYQFDYYNDLTWDDNWDIHGPRRFSVAVHSLIALGEQLLVHGIFMGFNRFVIGSRWALPTGDSIKESFTEAWIWERTDGFKVNQIGHPLQGGLYYNAARVNGFNFYESAIFGAFGSFAWEALGESNHASINDFVVTATASLSMGEIMYRLYVEARSNGIPAVFALFLNPVAGVHSLITGWKPPQTQRNTYIFDVSIGGGFTFMEYDVENVYGNLASIRAPYPEITINYIYGNPYETESRAPFRHFEIFFNASANMVNVAGLRLFTDGYLFSYAPIYNDKNRMSTGLSLSYDFTSIGSMDMYDGYIDHFSNALNWAVKYQHFFTENTSFQVKGHAGVTFMGVSNYFNTFREVRELKNYGGGVNAKSFFILENNKHYRFEINHFFYVMWTFPDTSAIKNGTVYWNFTDIIATWFITDRVSLGAAGFIGREWGVFGNRANTTKTNNSVRTFVGWRF